MALAQGRMLVKRGNSDGNAHAWSQATLSNKGRTHQSFGDEHPVVDNVAIVLGLSNTKLLNRDFCYAQCELVLQKNHMLMQGGGPAKMHLSSRWAQDEMYDANDPHLLLVTTTFVATDDKEQILPLLRSSKPEGVSREQHRQNIHKPLIEMFKRAGIQLTGITTDVGGLQINFGQM